MKLTHIAAALACVAMLPAQAALTHDLADLNIPLVVDFESYDSLLTSGPELVAPGITFTGDEGSQLGANIAVLGTNGIWGAGNFFAASGFVGEMRFTFADLTAGAGAFANHYADDVLPFGIVVSAYGDNNQIIESHTLSIDTDASGTNEGSFVGIARATADVRSISFKGNAIVLDNLAVATPVPEPETYAMLLAGLGLIGAAVRRRK